MSTQHEKFEEIFTSVENSIFKVVFFPDRIYHAQYLNATRSPRYRYNVREVRGYLDINVLKGEVYFDGEFLCNFLRIEYRASRLVEQIRERGRTLRDELLVWAKLLPEGKPAADALLKMYYDAWIGSYQCEVWETLEPPAGRRHDFMVQDMMGKGRPITRVASFGPALSDLRALRRLELAFRESDRDVPMGYNIGNPGWDNNYLRSHQEPRTQQPSDSQNTVNDENYLIDFQRGWYQHTSDVAPVRYRNAMMEPNNPDARPDNIIEMRWLFQREFSGSVVFFHEVTVPPGKVEGTHQHIGSEELYYVTEGEGFAYMRVGDDPATDSFPTVTREVFGIGPREFKELPVKPGSMIFTKSGGMHGIRNPSPDKPLKFVAFLYHQ
jgi:mannose-6-phosphate isomerase-like protein (cupin superfamily)